MTKLLFSGVPFAYAIFNVTIMLAYANSLLGPVPFDLIRFFAFLSIAGIIATLPAYLALRQHRIGLLDTAFVFALFCGLTWFNFWCGYSASAAV